MKMKVSPFTIMIVLLFMGGTLNALEFATGRGNGLGGGLLLSESSASVLVSVPTGGIKPGEGKIEITAERRFEINDLDQMSVAAAYRYNNLTLAMGIAQFGYRDFYAERTGKINLSYQTGIFSGGISLSGMLVDFGGYYEQLRASTFGLGMAVRTEKIYGALVADNIDTPTLHDNGLEMNPIYTAYVEYRTNSAISSIGRMTLEDTKKPQLAVGQYFYISKKVSMFWGLASEPTVFGGGLEVSHRLGGISYATSYHPVLGFVHRISLSMGFGKKDDEEDKVF